MQEILMALFGGGIADWHDINKTMYSWLDIFEKMKQNDFLFEEVEMNDIYQTILEIALEELEQAMQEYEGETSEEFKKCMNNINKYFSIITNYMCSEVRFIGSEELAEEIQEKMESKIDDINESIGFTYLNFDI